MSVLRWDPRDTGLSADGGDRYTVSTLADDAVALLDAAGVQNAHVVGISMAGLTMTHLAARHPSRVRGLTYVSTMSPHPEAGMGEDFFGALDVDATDRVAALVHAMGATTESDRRWAAASIDLADGRAPFRPAAVERHQEAAFRLDWPTMEALDSIRVPVHVVHGRLDRVLPVAHAEALASGIAGSSLTIVDDMGHIPRLGDWLTIAELVTAAESRP